MPDVALTVGELGDHLQTSVVPASANIAIRRAVSWLRTSSGLANLTETALPDDLWADALELAGLAYDNPTTLASETVGTTARSWPAIQRRAEILADVKQRYQQAASGPRGSFPEAAPWPDPITISAHRCWP